MSNLVNEILLRIAKLVMAGIVGAIVYGVADRGSRDVPGTD